jgi:undecaprenyl-diphosphatase
VSVASVLQQRPVSRNLTRSGRAHPGKRNVGHMHRRHHPVLGLAVATLCAVALAIAVHARWGPIETVDVSVARALNHAVRRHPAAVTFWKLVSLIGSPVVWDVLAAVLVGVLCLRRRFWTAGSITVALLGATMLSTVLKVLIGRPRPTSITPLAHASGMSFPSGHALTSFVSAGMSVVLLMPMANRTARAWAVACAASVTLLIGFSRMILGVHYLSDVLGAWLIGAVWLGVVVGGLRRSDDPVHGRASEPNLRSGAAQRQDADDLVA